MCTQEFDDEFKVLKTNYQLKSQDKNMINQEYKRRERESDEKFLQIYHHLLSILLFFVV